MQPSFRTGVHAADVCVCILFCLDHSKARDIKWTLELQRGSASVWSSEDSNGQEILKSEGEIAISPLVLHQLLHKDIATHPVWNPLAEIYEVRDTGNIVCFFPSPPFPTIRCPSLWPLLRPSRGNTDRGALRMRALDRSTLRKPERCTFDSPTMFFKVVVRCCCAVLYCGSHKS